jgi:hypothetical protein
MLVTWAFGVVPSGVSFSGPDLSLMDICVVCLRGYSRLGRV